MPLLSLRLPDDLDARLDRAARSSGRPKSELARDAIALYLDKRLKADFVAEYVRAAMRERPSDIRFEAEEFLPLENEALALEEPRGRAPRVREASPRYRGKPPRRPR